jgi:hypothetical protein
MQERTQSAILYRNELVSLQLVHVHSLVVPAEAVDDRAICSAQEWKVVDKTNQYGKGNQRVF